MINAVDDPSVECGRVVPVDVLRGVAMLLLIGEATGLYRLLLSGSGEGKVLHSIGSQLSHHPWDGLRLWDLGQPLFMFISGVAMVFSYERRSRQGEGSRRLWERALSRSFLLLILGWALNHISPMEDGPSYLFLIDVLPQLAFANILAFLLMKKRYRTQILVAAALIVLTEMLYRFWPVPGFDQGFIPDRNFGAFVDMSLFGHLSEGHWVTFNMIPASVHTIMGSIAGQLLRDAGMRPRALRFLAWTGAGCGILGLGLSLITPIVKRISTSSYVLVTGAVSLLSLVLCFRLALPREHGGRARVFSVMGMNSLFIYAFALSGGGDWLIRLTDPFVRGLVGWAGEFTRQALLGLAVWTELWLLCYWLYKKKIYIRI